MLNINSFIQFFKYSLVGISNVAVSLLFFYTMIYLFSVHYLVANIIAFIAGLTNSYIFNNKWVFKSNSIDPKTSLKFLSVNVTNFIINSLLLVFFVEQVALSPFWAQPIIIFITTVLGFFLNKFWVFRKDHS